MKYIIFTKFPQSFGQLPLLKGAKVLFFCIILSIFGNIFGAKVEISSNSREYNIDDNIQLIIEIESDASQNGELQITGIEDNFHIVGQSQSTQTQNINGAVQQKQYFNIAMLAHESGKYSLGPVILTYEDGSVVTSNKVDIEITGERIMVNPNLPTKNITNNSGSTPPQDLSKIQLGNKAKNTEKIKDILGIDGEPMTDIYDIRPNIIPKPYHIFGFIFAVLGTILFLGGHQIWKIFSTPHVGEKKKTKKSINYGTLLKKLEKKHRESSTEIFYGQLGQLFRSYLDDKVSYGLSGKSLTEAKKILPKQLHTVYSDIYFPAYNTKRDTIKNRTQIISELGKIFSKK